eukprot:GHVQ01004593.1.p1 GENE.GHVQ01004593.1~~GHVQ01004593.1.p1  ORF type:complete len:300 (+),score=42.58 GHVQ01004593.1:826-1725(+)
MNLSTSIARDNIPDNAAINIHFATASDWEGSDEEDPFLSESIVYSPPSTLYTQPELRSSHQAPNYTQGPVTTTTEHTPSGASTCNELRAHDSQSGHGTARSGFDQRYLFPPTTTTHRPSSSTNHINQQHVPVSSSSHPLSSYPQRLLPPHATLSAATVDCDAASESGPPTVSIYSGSASSGVPSPDSSYPGSRSEHHHHYLNEPGVPKDFMVMDTPKHVNLAQAEQARQQHPILPPVLINAINNDREDKGYWPGTAFNSSEAHARPPDVTSHKAKGERVLAPILPPALSLHINSTERRH